MLRSPSKTMVKWLARFHLAKVSSPPREIHDWILQNEAATMLYLQQHTCIPTPKVFNWARKSDPRNKIRVDYILMEKLEGKPLIWQEATPQQREKAMQQLADIFLEIEKHHFKIMGSSLCLLHGRHYYRCSRSCKSVNIPGGKGKGSTWSILFFTERLTGHLGLLPCNDIQWRDWLRLFNRRLPHRFCQDNIGALFEDNTVSSGNNFFLKRPDDKRDHILVNDSFEIVGLIYWEWTQTVSKAEAFCSPCMMWPLREFYDGSNELTTYELRLAAIFWEKGRGDLANYAMDGGKVQRLFFSLGPERSFVDTQAFSNLFIGLQKAFNRYEDGLGSWTRLLRSGKMMNCSLTC